MICYTVDSSAWVSVMSGDKRSKKIESLLSKSKKVIVPSLVLFEVYKHIKKKAGEDEALKTCAYLSSFCIEELDREIALSAADISISTKLAMADSIVAAHAQRAGAKLLTCDNDFRVLDYAEILS